MKVNPKQDAQLSLQLMSDPRLLAGVRAMISHAAGRFGFSELECNQIGLAIDEALCNVINHGYERRMDGSIWLSAMFIEAQDQNPPSAVFLIEDLAKQVDGKYHCELPSQGASTPGFPEPLTRNPRGFAF